MNNYCIISHQYKFIYIPIAKVACTSILNRIAEIIHENNRGRLIRSHRDVHSNRSAIFNTQFSELNQNTLDAIDKHKDYFIFCFTRNPFERVLSCYIDKLSTQTYGYDKNLINRYPQMYRGMSFYEFLQSVNDIPIDQMDEHFRPQHTFFPAEKINFIGKLENIKKDWEIIEEKLSLAHLPLPVFNKTEEVDCYDNRTENLVRKIYKKDFERLTYSFNRKPKIVSRKSLPLTVNAAKGNLYPFKDVLVQNKEDNIHVTITGEDPILIIPYFLIKNGKGIVIDVHLVSPISTTLVFYYTTNKEREAPHRFKKERNIIPGENEIKIIINDPEIIGRLRLNPSSKQTSLLIKQINISEKTLPWLEDKEDLTHVAKKLFSLPSYAQNHKNLFSMVNFASLFEPILKTLQPEYVCEIGCDEGNNTKFLSEHCNKNNAKLVIVDPVKPGLDFSQEKCVEFVQMKSIDFLKDTQFPINTFFIDGDHNYQTVFQELVLIDQMKDKSEKPFCVFMHDISWPWAFRDLYYSPEDLNLSKSQYIRGQSVSLYSQTPDMEGLPGNSYAIARSEGGANNGVKKAIDDFIRQYEKDWSYVEISSLYGLGVLWTQSRLDSEQQAVFETLQDSCNFFREFLSILEWNRLALYSQTLKQAETWKKQKQYIEKLEKLSARSIKEKLVDFIKQYIKFGKST